MPPAARDQSECRYRLLWIVSLALLATSGCSRAFYRNQADREVYQVVAEKSNDPRWAVPGFSVLPDPRSRNFDPHDPDCQPMPQDDPYSYQLMQCIDGKKGYRRWLKHGVDYDLDPQQWRAHLAEYVEITPEGAVRMGLNDAVRVALINSRDYQDQLETLYLSALDVTTERFAFDSQYFLGTGPTFRHRGALNPGGERNTLNIVTDGQLRRTFATGGNLVVGFANQFLWEFSGPNTNNTNTLLTFALAQPLLRGSGRALNLERLTRTERTLLANVRQFERYRHGFYTGIAIGDDIRGLTRAGGFFGGTGLTGFTGTGAGGIGGVGSGQFGFDLGGAGGGGGGAAGVAGLAGGGEGNVGGYIGMLQLLQQIRNSRASLNAKLRNLEVLQANYEAGLINLTQVDTFRQSIETERAQLLQQENNLQTQLDNFKVQRLSLPPDLQVELDDTMIRRFQLIDPKVTDLDERLSNFVADFGDYEQTPTSEELAAAIQRLDQFASEIRPLMTTTQGDLARLESASPARTRDMTPGELQQFQQDKERLNQTLADLEANFARHEANLRQLASDVSAQPPTVVADRIVTLCVELIAIVQELSLIQVRARLDSITLDPLNVTPEQALEIARANRLDWMNNRAALVDTWRLIEFNANALLSDLDVIVDGDIGTVGNNPVKFRAPTGGLRAGLRFDTPLTRLIERNNYRQALISYQQARRNQMEFEDGVFQAMRARMRSLDQFRRNLEIQRLAVVIAARRVDQTRETLNAPPPPAEPGAAPSQLGPTAAEDLLSALTALRDAQNNFMSVWLNYYAGRMLLYRDMGIMKLDPLCIWIDEPFRVEDWLPADGCGSPLPPGVPPEWIRALGDFEAEGLQMEPPGGAAEGVPAPPAEVEPTEAHPPSSPSPLFGPRQDSPSAQPRVIPPQRYPTSPGSSAIPASRSSAPAPALNDPSVPGPTAAARPVPAIAPAWPGSSPAPAIPVPLASQSPLSEGPARNLIPSSPWRPGMLRYEQHRSVPPRPETGAAMWADYPSGQSNVGNHGPPQFSPGH